MEDWSYVFQFFCYTWVPWISFGLITHLTVSVVTFTLRVMRKFVGA